MTLCHHRYILQAAFKTSRKSCSSQVLGLRALTKYYLNVQVNDVTQLAPPYPSFSTFAVAGDPVNFKFVVITDFETIRTLTTTSRSFESAAAENPAFAFIGGDFDHRNPVTLTEKRTMFQDLYNPNTFGYVSFRQSDFAQDGDCTSVG